MRICSVTVTSRTKEKIIGDAIKSVRDWVDGVWVLLIPQGEDDTMIKAWEATDGFVQLETTDTKSTESTMGEWRNEVLGHVSGAGYDWAVMLDTDERILPNGVNIRKMLEKLPESVRYVDVMSDTGKYQKTRFFRLPFTGNFRAQAHEQLDAEDQTILAHTIRFHELPKSDEVLQARLVNDLKALYKQQEEDPTNLRWPYYIAATLEAQGHFDVACERYRELAELEPDLGLRGWVLLRAANCCQNLRNPEGALADAICGIGYCPNMAELYWMAGAACYNTRRYRDAMAFAQCAILHGASSKGLNPPRTGNREPEGLWDGPFTLMSICHKALGDEKSAKAWEAQAKTIKIQRDRFAQKGM